MMYVILAFLDTLVISLDFGNLYPSSLCDISKYYFKKSII